MEDEDVLTSKYMYIQSLWCVDFKLNVPVDAHLVNPIMMSKETRMLHMFSAFIILQFAILQYSMVQMV